MGTMCSICVQMRRAHRSVNGNKDKYKSLVSFMAIKYALRQSGSKTLRLSQRLLQTEASPFTPAFPLSSNNHAHQ